MILITGASGFIGRHLLSSLLEKYGADALLVLTSKPISNCRYLLHNNYSFEDDFFIKNGFDAIDTIIHAGSYTPKNGSEANNWRECNSNINSTDRLLKAKLPKLKRFIFLSTADVYKAEEVIEEESFIEPISLYAHSKWYSELMIRAWAKTLGADATILRIGHAYGPGEESYQKVIPMVIQKLLKKEKLRIVGTGDEVRSFIFVKDVVDVILNGLELGYGADIVNVAGSVPITIHNLFKKLIAISGQSSLIDFVPSDSKARNLIFTNSRMRQILNHTETSLDIGLKQEWDYMKSLFS